MEEPARPTLPRRPAFAYSSPASWALLAVLAGAPPCAQATTERVEGEIVLHGRRLAVERLREPVAARDAAAATARRWRSDGGPVVETRSGEWWIVSRHRSDRIETEQWRERSGGAADGIRSTLPRRSSPAPWAPLSPASRLGLSPVAESESLAGGRSIRTAVYRSPDSPGHLHARWRAALPAEGFRPPASAAPLASPPGDAERAGAARAGGGYAGLHRSATEEIAWTVAPHRGGSALVVHRGRIDRQTKPFASDGWPVPISSTENAR